MLRFLILILLLTSPSLATELVFGDPIDSEPAIALRTGVDIARLGDVQLNAVLSGAQLYVELSVAFQGPIDRGQVDLLLPEGATLQPADEEMLSAGNIKNRYSYSLNYFSVLHLSMWPIAAPGFPFPVIHFPPPGARANPVVTPPSSSALTGAARNRAKAPAFHQLGHEAWTSLPWTRLEPDLFEPGPAVSF